MRRLLIALSLLLATPAIAATQPQTTNYTSTQTGTAICTPTAATPTTYSCSFDQKTAAMTIGPLTSGSTQTGGGGVTPVVTALNCTVSSGFTNGQNVNQTRGAGVCGFAATCSGGACTGGNAITGWSISAQSCASCYSISATGILQGGSNAANVTTEADTVTVKAINSTGTSAGVTQTITAYADGSVGAPSGSPQWPSMLVGEAARPPWNVAGVDYHVGTSGTLTPYTGQTISGWSYSAPDLTSTTNGATLSGYDFSGINNFQLQVQHSNVTINNILVKVINTSGNAQVPIAFFSGITGCVMTNSEINGNNLKLNNAFLVNLTGDACTLKYNWIHDTAEQTTAEGAGAINLLFNLLENSVTGADPGAHGDIWESATNDYSNMLVSFNTVYQHSTAAGGGGGSQGFDFSNTNSSTTPNTGIVYSYNTVMTAATAINQANIDLFVRPPNNNGYTITLNTNYVDLTSSGFYSSAVFMASSSGTGTRTCTGNINMATGGSISSGC